MENKGDKIGDDATVEFFQDIMVESLDDIVVEHKYHKVDIVITDIEGYEYFALLGMNQILSKHLVINMIIELHPHFLAPRHVSDIDIAYLLNLHGQSV